MKKTIIILSAVVLLASCAHSKVEWVDFQPKSADGLDPAKSFIPFGTPITSVLDGETIKSLGLPCNETIGSELTKEEAEGETKTTSTNGTGLVKNLISNVHSKRVISYCGSYYSEDQYGNPVKLSGRVVLPADGKVSRIMVVGHFTIGADSEAPSNELTMESIYAARGLAVIEPDYIGYGITRDLIHPYLCCDLTAKNVTDMYFACLPFLEKIGCKPQYDDIFLLGFSQGGAVTMGTVRYLEKNYKDIKIRLAMCGGGPYDICATYDTLIENDYSDYPCAVPMIVQGMKIGMGLEELDYKDFFTQYMVDNMEEWLNSKKYTMQEITGLIGSNYLSAIMTPNARDKSTDCMTDFYRVMLENSLTKQDWLPYCPIYLFHSIDDNVVPFVNASNMERALHGANVIYNFGHYGNHVKACLRFLYATITLMYEHGDLPESI